jgi:hypothetical protein
MEKNKLTEQTLEFMSTLYAVNQQKEDWVRDYNRLENLIFDDIVAAHEKRDEFSNYIALSVVDKHIN